MKLFKKLLILSIIAAIIEGTMFSYLDKTYAGSSGHYKEVKVEEKSKSTSFVNVKIPDNAENVKVSSDGRYICYLEKGILKVINTADGNINKVEVSEDSKVHYYRWLPEDDLILLCEKDDKNKIRFFSYDAGKNVKREMEDLHFKKTVIELEDKKDSIDNIALSTLNHVIYAKILHRGKNCDIYRFNIMNQAEKQKNIGKIIGNILMLSNENTTLVFEDIRAGQIKYLDVTSVEVKKGKDFELRQQDKISTLKFSQNSKKVLLSTDEQNKIYVGEIYDDKVKNILYGDLDAPTDSWKTLNLTSPVDKNDLIITKEGNIYINDNLKGTVKNIVSNTETKYTGKFIELQGKYIYSIFDSKINRFLIK